jgi:ribosome-associated protein
MARAALNAKAEDMVILDLRKLSYSFDFFLLCSASSDRRIETVADHILEALSQADLKPAHREGRPDGGWLLLDFGPVVAHVFSPEAREFYKLERLWADAPQVRLPR